MVEIKNILYLLFIFQLIEKSISNYNFDDKKKGIINRDYQKWQFLQNYSEEKYLDNNYNELDIIKDSNITDQCAVKTNELLTYLLNPTNSTKNFSDFQNFILFSGISFNDLGDYTNCSRDEKSNYLYVILNITNTFVDLGLCYFKECNTTYIENSKLNLMTILNLKFNMNFTGHEVYFTDPKETIDSYREKRKNGLIICLIIMIFIASLSFIRLFTKNFKPLNVESNNNYQNLLENSNNDSNQINQIINSKLTDDTNSKYRKNQSSVLENFLKNFDLIVNTKTIFKIENNNKTFEYLRVFDGVRFLSTCWVLWGHVFFIAVRAGLRNFYDLLNKVEKFSYCILTSAVISVDVFFYMSGFLLYFNLKKYLKPKTNKVRFFIAALIQRYLRLMPFYLIGIFVITNVMPFLVDGPRNGDIEVFLFACEKYWWHNLLFLQNFFSSTYESTTNGISCVAHSWYLADDMIYFIFSTIIILLVYNKRLIKNLIFVLIFMGSCVYQIYLIIENNYTISYKHQSEQKGNYFNDFYIQPMARITPYMLGILYCELFFETDVYKDSQNFIKKEIENDGEKNFLRRFNLYLKESNKLCFFIFILSLIQIFYGVFIIWFPQNFDMGRGWQVFFITFNKIFFINGLGSLIHLLFLEKFSIIKKILSFTFFSVMSRITYGVYILHYYVVMIFFYNSDTSFRLDLIEFSFYATGLMLLTLILSFVFGILFESPVINMLKVLRTNEKRERKSIQVTPEDDK